MRGRRGETVGAKHLDLRYRNLRLRNLGCRESWPLAATTARNAVSGRCPAGRIRVRSPPGTAANTAAVRYPSVPTRLASIPTRLTKREPLRLAPSTAVTALASRWLCGDPGSSNGRTLGFGPSCRGSSPLPGAVLLFTSCWHAWATEYRRRRTGVSMAGYHGPADDTTDPTCTGRIDRHGEGSSR